MPREQVHVLRFGSLIEEPTRALDDVAAFLGIETGLLSEVPANNTRLFAQQGPVADSVGRVIRAGAALGAHVPPQLWRQASKPLIAYRQRGAAPRPRLDPDLRARLVDSFADDIALLESLTGLDLAAWRSTEDRGSYLQRSGTVPVA